MTSLITETLPTTEQALYMSFIFMTIECLKMGVNGENNLNVYLKKYMLYLIFQNIYSNH